MESLNQRYSMCSGSVVRPIIPAFRAEDSGSNPDRSTIVFFILNVFILIFYAPIGERCFSVHFVTIWQYYALMLEYISSDHSIQTSKFKIEILLSSAF